MTHPWKAVPAAEFKAKCLALLDEVASTGQGIVVTKRGKAMVRVVPIEEERVPSLRGSILYQGDVVSPIGGRRAR
jgi:prevent-host-death family protein